MGKCSSENCEVELSEVDVEGDDESQSSDAVVW